MGVNRRHPPALAAAWALLALAVAACGRLPPHLAVPSVPIGDRAWAATAAAHLSAPVVGGNRVEVLQDGEEIFPAMLAAIASARSTVTYEQFVYKDGAVSQALTEAFAERCRAGVRVHVLIDAYGARFMPDAYVTQLRRAGCQVVDAFRPLRPAALGRANFRTHRRVLVVDGRVGFTGGSGVFPGSLGAGTPADRWRETDLRIEGPAVHQLQGAFAEHWQEATGVVLGGAPYYPALEPAGPVAAQIVRSSPVQGNHAIYTLLRLAIAGARRSIYITNQYLILDEGTRQALARAVQRGVDVVVLMPARPTNRLVRLAEQAGMGTLLAAGVEVYEYTGGLLHAKTMVVDGVWATIGSANLDPRSFALNDELNAVVHDPDVAARMEAAFAADLARAPRLTMEAWRERRLGRFLGWLLTPIHGQL